MVGLRYNFNKQVLSKNKYDTNILGKDNYRNNITKSILEGCNKESIDVGAISESLSQLNTAFEELTTNSKDITEKNNELSKTNESLRSVNMKLFTQIGIANNEGKDDQEISWK